MEDPVISRTITGAVEAATGLNLAQPEMGEVIETVTESNLPDIVRDLKVQAKENLETDYNFARDNLRTLLTRGMTAVEGAIQLARESESPRVYEATSTFIKTLAELNKDLLSLSETAVKAQPASPDPNTQNATTINNNAIYVGSSEDLAGMIQKRLREL